ncbi:MAG: CvpA family protein, partial [Candidatus Delongbacteria bacterium]|nr:CvpA family protein [Candidatus Delongbacteria bacterium]
MNFIDIIVVALIALYAVIGFWKGFIVQLFHIAGIFCAFYFNTPVSLFISEKLSSEPEPERYVLLLTGIAAFFLIFAVFFI